MVIESVNFFLQEISIHDLNNIHKLHSYPEVDEFNTVGLPDTLEDTRIIVNQMIEDRKITPRKSYTWKITNKISGEFIGICGLILSLDKFRLGEIYYKILPQHWGKGYATEVGKLIVTTGFDEFNLHKVEAGVAIGNLRSIRVLEKLGMIREGQRRKILPIRGKWVDNFHYGIVEDDPREY